LNNLPVKTGDDVSNLLVEGPHANDAPENNGSDQPTEPLDEIAPDELLQGVGDFFQVRRVLLDRWFKLVVAAHYA
jgi:hypothetical protein